MNLSKEPKELVADQSGLLWSVIGLFITLFLGFSIRALIAPERIKKHVDKAIQRIHPDFVFRKGEVYLSLSDGLFPEFSVVVKNVSISTENTCWMKLTGEINELRLPISFSHLIKGNLRVHVVEMDEFSLKLREDYQACEAFSFSEESFKTSISPYQKTSNLEVARSSSGSIDTLEIRTLKINYEAKSFSSVEVQRFSLKILSQQPQHIIVTGKVNFFGEALSGEHSSKADMKIEYSEKEESRVEANIKGNLREGVYLVQAEIKPHAKEFKLSGNMEHIPLSQVFPLLKKYHVMENDFNGKQAWLSLFFESQGKIKELEKSSLKISNFRIEGDVGAIESSKIEIDTLEPFQVKPMVFQLHGVNIDNFFIFLNRHHPSPALGHLGVFNGSAFFKNKNQVEIVGDHSGLEFVFSNRGKREMQTMSLISGEMQLDRDHWTVTIRRMRPHEGVLEGNIFLRADRDWRDLEVDLNLDELTLSPKVQRVMTGGGEVGAISGDLNISFKQGQLMATKGFLKVRKYMGDGVLAQNINFKIDTRNSIVSMDSNVNEITVDPKSTSGEILRPFIEDWMLTGGNLVLKSVVSKIRTQQLQTFEWSGLQAQISGSRGWLQSLGGWDENGFLNGFISLKDKSKDRNKEKKWFIVGDRNQPRFLPASESH